MKLGQTTDGLAAGRSASPPARLPPSTASIAPRNEARLRAAGADGGRFNSLVFADTQNITPEVWGQPMLAARDTERIELGTAVTNPGTRDAAVTASAALALQVESNARGVRHRAW